MKSSKTIADEFLRRKAREDIEAEKADELVREILEQKLVEKEAELKAEKEAEKSKGLEVHTTKPTSDLEVHAVEPVIKPVIKKPIVQEKISVQEKPIVQKKPVVKKRWYDRIRPFGFKDSE